MCFSFWQRIWSDTKPNQPHAMYVLENTAFTFSNVGTTRIVEVINVESKKGYDKYLECICYWIYAMRAFGTNK